MTMREVRSKHLNRNIRKPEKPIYSKILHPHIRKLKKFLHSPKRREIHMRSKDSYKKIIKVQNRLRTEPLAERTALHVEHQIVPL